ncbi:L,D-transpeptidase [Ancylobacter radicis]|uniref:L,D-transpeptidase family protein n=1 Tax=Ancylobacter radicis TaxID=2836179 RepID=A0ABS5R3W1_9HYPH|nr:L,D-transpeptidase [Ancylobacter radicis]MBS9475606.1 L,D-transpeptidase family protein [Ancylobacter radicis]
MMVVRLGFAPAVALIVLASAGTAGAQSYPAAQSSASPYEAATSPTEAEIPAPYDPYGATAAAPAGQPASTTPPGVRDPYAQPIAGAGQVPAAAAPGASNVPPGVAPIANAPYSDPSRQPAGYPSGAYSGQQPAGMASPYGQAPANNYGQPPAYGSAAAQPGAPVYAPPAAVGSAPRQDLNNSYGSNGSSVAMLPPEDQPEDGPAKPLPDNLRRQVVDYVTKEPPGTIIIDTPNTYLYYVLPGGKAERYGIGVGREGFTWAGTEKISRKAEWADWRPPAEMIERQPYLPRFMAGGPGNPLGARTMYLGGTIYRIHGTNQPSTIGQFMSSGCIRMLNEDVENLYDRVKVGTRVVVLPGNTAPKTAEAPLDPQPMPVSTAASGAPGVVR